MKSPNCKEMICKNPNSKFKGILSDDVVNGIRSIGFVFRETHEEAFWPVNTTCYELLKDGWELCQNL